MDYKKFEDCVKTRIQEHLQSEGYEKDYKISKVVDAEKNTDCLHVVIPKLESEFKVDMSSMYSAFKKIQNMEFMLTKVSQLIAMALEKWDPESKFDYDKVKERLFIKVQNLEQNKDAMKNRVYTPIADLAITYHGLIRVDAYGRVAFEIRQKELESYGIKLEELHKDAIQNAARLFPCKVVDMDENLEEISLANGDLRNMMRDLESIQMQGKSTVIVTNSCQLGGAAALFYPDTMETLSRAASGNYFILPVSVDELMVFSDDGSTELSVINADLQYSNRYFIQKDMQLGDEAYYYDAKNKIFDKASNFTHLLGQSENQKLTGPVGQGM